MRKKFVWLLVYPTLVITSYGQNHDWYNKDLSEDGILGVSIDKSYERVSPPRQKVIVAIIDSGVDVEHEDLAANIWVNTDEIPGNNIDDDNNGYVDDLNGWNFLGGADGQNVVTETYGEVRHYQALKKKFSSMDTLNLSVEHQGEFGKMKELKVGIDKKVAASEKELKAIAEFDETLGQIQFLLKPFLDGQEATRELLETINEPNEGVQAAKSIMLQLVESGFDKEDYEAYKEYHRIRRDYHYNISYNPRGIVGDDPEDPYERYYGNNDLNGGHADHGTHVAGIIGGVRGNDIGIDGVADHVELMILRAVPDGDERDKDIANAILYAVENGARIINMSFGKGYSPHKGAIDRAIRLAEANNVLIVHAAGNAAVDIDEATHYPVRTFSNGERAGNWIEVGASDRIPNEYLVATFSNYGRTEVDVFAPGVDILSTIPGSRYKENSGTSMAAPVVSGVAAAVLSRYPDLTAQELKSVILKGATSFKSLKVLYPNTAEERTALVKFKKLSSTGAVVNLERSLELAEKIATR